MGLDLLKAPAIQGIVTGHRRALEDFVRAVDLIELKPVIVATLSANCEPRRTIWTAEHLGKS